VESSCEFGIEPLGSINAGKLSSGLTSNGFSSSTQLHRVSELLYSLGTIIHFSFHSRSMYSRIIMYT
jgi:hypothetical protein